MYAATTTLMEIVVDHGQDRMRAHEKLWAAVTNRPAWMVPSAIAENLDTFEMEIYVKESRIPFRFEAPVRLPVGGQTSKPLGTSCVMDLGGCLHRPGSLRMCEVFKEVEYSVARLVYEHTNAVDPRADLAIAYLAHFLSALRVAEKDMFGDALVRDFTSVLSITDLMRNNSFDYHHMVHRHFLRSMPDTATDADVQRQLMRAMRVTEYVEGEDGTFHGFLALEALEAVVRATTTMRIPSFRVGLHCAIAFAEASHAPPTEGDAPPPVAAPPQWHHFAVVWEANLAQQEAAMDTD
jgi:hypothetical protein